MKKKKNISHKLLRSMPIEYLEDGLTLHKLRIDILGLIEEINNFNLLNLTHI